MGAEDFGDKSWGDTAEGTAGSFADAPAGLTSSGTPGLRQDFYNRCLAYRSERVIMKRVTAGVAKGSPLAASRTPLSDFVPCPCA